MRKHDLLTQALDRYHNAIGRAVVDQTKWAAPRRAVGAVLLPIAILYATMAEIHAFADGNSRTRNMVLQSELTRLGGHPLLLPDTGWGVYHMQNESVVESFILDGWCA
jgi:fido (protein-threonine AMPylation protein)